MIGRDDSRLVTLTGPGGVGKTRVALEVATRSEDRFAEGVLFTDLSPRRQSGLVIAAVARQVGYSTPFALSSAFKRAYGVSPNTHRATSAYPA